MNVSEKRAGVGEILFQPLMLERKGTGKNSGEVPIQFSFPLGLSSSLSLSVSVVSRSLLLLSLYLEKSLCCRTLFWVFLQTQPNEFLEIHRPVLRRKEFRRVVSGNLVHCLEERYETRSPSLSLCSLPPLSFSSLLLTPVPLLGRVPSTAAESEPTPNT